MISTTKRWTTLLLLLIAGTMTAQVKLPTFFNNNMVLQQGIQIPVWGWASPGEKVTVTLERGTASTRTNKGKPTVVNIFSDR
jgi:sialate O-acetylesterase